jgi:DNA-directed RNA polymerase subunit RPC12/RpoP
MQKIKIKCPSCSKVIAIDPAKLPDKPVRIACPGCGNKIAIDKTKLKGPEPPTESERSEAPFPGDTPDPPLSAASDDMTATAGINGLHPEAQPFESAPTAPDTPEPEPAASPLSSMPPSAGIISPGSGAEVQIPPGIVIGADQKVIQGLTTILRPVGCSIEHVSSSEIVTRLQEMVPSLIIYVAGELNGPPYEPLAPILALPPAERRQTYVVLISDNLRTLDGSAAFFYQVNMILNAHDIPKAVAAISSGIEYHQKLYRAMLAAIEAKEAGQI